MKYPGFVGPTYQSIARRAEAEDAINLFAEVIESGTGVNNAVLLGTPGLQVFGTLPTSPVRGLWAGDNRCFAVAGAKLYEVFSDGSYSLRGDVGDDADHSPVDIWPNGNQLMVVSAGKVWVDNGAGPVQPTYPASTGTVNVFNGLPFVYWVNDGGDQFSAAWVGKTITIGGSPYTVTSVPDPTVLFVSVPFGADATLAYSIAGDYILGTSGTFLDGYFIVNIPNSRQVQISAVNNGLDWDGLDFAVKEAYADNVVRVLADHEELWVMGSQSIEIWRNTGNADFPLERDPGGFMHYGVNAFGSVCRFAGGVAWLAGDSQGSAVAYHAVGFQPKRISNHAVEQAWRTMPKTSDCIGYSYEDRGHKFLVFSFPAADQTWVYDAITGLWHRRAYSGTFNRHRGRCHAAVFNKHLVGDWQNGNIYDMSEVYTDDAGTAIHYVRTAPHIVDGSENDWIFFHSFELIMQTGDTANPQITLRWSNDGGSVWSSPVTVTAGAIGDTTKRVIWRRLGRSRDRIFSVSFTGGFPVRLINADLRLTQGTA